MERKWIYRGAAAVLVVGTAIYFGSRGRNNSHADHVIIPKPASPLSTPGIAKSLSSTTTPTESRQSGATIIKSRGDTFEVALDPEGRGRQCVKLRPYKKGNKQDVDGAAIALGSNPETYDIQNGIVYSASGTVIGEFAGPSLPDSVFFHTVPVGAIICDNISQ